MPILFNDVRVSDDKIAQGIADYMPATKSKIVCFGMVNAIPFHAWLLEGKQPRMGGEYQLPADNMTEIQSPPGFGRGSMRYYSSSKLKPVKGGASYTDYAPNFITFEKQCIIFDASKNKDLFFFLLYHSRNEKNAQRIGEVPLFRFVDSKEGAKKNVGSMNLEVDALVAVKEMFEKKSPKLRTLYEALGNVDFDEYAHHSIHESKKNWEAILEPIYNECKKNPKKILDMIKDTGLDVNAEIMNALSLGLIKQEGNAYFWGDQVKGEKEGKKITNVPKGKADNAQEWFIDWLKDERLVLEEISREVEKKKKNNA